MAKKKPVKNVAKKKVVKNPVAQAMVAMRNKKLSPARRHEIARKAAAARWADKGSSTSSKPKTGDL